jgi:hypothetical protein
MEIEGGRRESSRMARERATVRAMIRMSCSTRHGTGGGLCDSCRELQAYADARLERCPFQDGKPTCANCLVHCYKPEMRERIREVMRFAGPRMLSRHPILAVRHILDGRRMPLKLPKNAGRNAGGPRLRG